MARKYNTRKSKTIYMFDRKLVRRLAEASETDEEDLIKLIIWMAKATGNKKLILKKVKTHG
jgi:hypothetical protein